MYPHRIRLRGPWRCEPVRADATGEPLPGAVLMNAPGRWRTGGLETFAGLACCTRRFGYPGTIDAFERVWLRVEGLAGPADISVNGQAPGTPFADDSAYEADVTALLRPHNEARLVFPVTAGGGPLWQEVYLEIRRTAFPRQLRVRVVPGTPPRLEVSGTAVGVSERPLDAYLLADNRTLAEATVTPDPMGRPFRLAADVDGVPETVRVDLVDGGVIWYAAEVPCGGAGREA